MNSWMMLGLAVNRPGAQSPLTTCLGSGRERSRSPHQDKKEERQKSEQDPMEENNEGEHEEGQLAVLF